MVMAIGLGPIDCKFKSYRSEPTKACFRALLQKLGKRGLGGGRLTKAERAAIVFTAELKELLTGTNLEIPQSKFLIPDP